MPMTRTAITKKWICSGDIPDQVVEQIKLVPFILKKDDPGIFIAYNSDEGIHEALSFNGPLPPGLQQEATPEASATLFKNWVHNTFTSVAGNSAFVEATGLESDSAFHHLTFSEYNRILFRLNLHPLWSDFCLNSQPQQSAGKFIGVNNAGRGSNEMVQLVIGPFVG